MKTLLRLLALSLCILAAHAQTRSVTVNSSGALVYPDASVFRSGIGLVIGTNVQAYDADLTTFAGITPSANVQTLLGSADYAAFRTSLGLVIGTDVQAYDADLADLADGTLTGSKVGTGIAAGNITSGTLAVANGGTGQTSASAAINALVPTQSGNSGKFLTTNGSAVSWATASGGGSAIDLGTTAAWIATTGNNTTGTVGDPSRPYLTAQAAVDDGATTLVLIGNGGTITDVGGAINLKVLSLGGTLGDLDSTGAITIESIGGTLTVATVNADGPVSLTGVTTASIGAGDGQSITLVDCVLDSNITCRGGPITAIRCNLANSTLNTQGIDGTTPADSEGTPGGGGGSITLSFCDGEATLNAYGGNGGNGFDDGMTSYNGGAGGNGGQITLINSTVANAYAAYGLGGSGTSGGSNGADGTNGAVIARYSDIRLSYTGALSASYAYVVNGTFYP